MKQENTLFETIYKLPLLGDEIKSYLELHCLVKTVTSTLLKLSKNNQEEIEKVCNGNSRLLFMAKLLREMSLPEGVKDISYSLMMSSIMGMFTLMLVSQKNMDFFNKMNVPFSIYRIVLRIYIQRGKNEFIKKAQIQESFKFFSRMISIKVKVFPRLFSLLIYNIIGDYSPKLIEKQNFLFIICTAIELVRNYLKLAAETGVLIILYKKAIEAEITWQSTVQLLDIIIGHMNNVESREIILKHLDLSRVFAIFTYVDPRPSLDRNQEKIERCAQIVEILLNSTPTLFYFIYEKNALKQFVNSLKSKSKSEKEINIINSRVFFRIIDRALRYDQIKMQRSNNLFGLYSNYLNHKALMVMSFFLDNTDLFDIYLNFSINKTIRDLGKLSLRYFPITFEKPKYNKEIIQSLGLPSVKNYQQLTESFLDILSYSNDCILNFEYTREEFLSFLLDIKHGHEREGEVIPPYLFAKVQDLLCKLRFLKKVDQIAEIIIEFYTTMMEVSEFLQWKPGYLKLTKFLSLLFYRQEVQNTYYLHSKCLEVMRKIFENPKEYFYQYLYITALDDVGQHLCDHEEVKQLIYKYIGDSNYSFRISRILFHMEFDKKNEESCLCQKDLLNDICKEGCNQLILLLIEIIKFYFHENDERAEWGMKLICKNLLYHQNEEIVIAAIEFCEEIANEKEKYYTFLMKIKLDQIRFADLRRRLMCLLLGNENSIKEIKEKHPKFIHEEIQKWTKEGPNLMNELSNFFERENKRYSANRELTQNYIDVGTVNENRHRLIFLPWNIQVNGNFYVALASYKYLKEKIKLRAFPNIEVNGNIEIKVFFIGALSIFPSEKSTLVIKKEEIMKNYEKKKDKDNKGMKYFAVSRDKITLFLHFNEGKLILERVSSQILLSKNVYMPIAYPLNFINLLTKTRTGLDSLREEKLMTHCINIIKEEKDYETCKGAIETLGLCFIANLENQEKIEIYEAISRQFEETKNLQLKEVALWTLNIIIKEEDFRKKMKESKGWLILQSKYCGWICYPQLYNRSEIVSVPLKRYDFLLNIFNNERISKIIINDEKGYQLIMKFLEGPDFFNPAADKDELPKLEKEYKIRRNQMLEHFKKPTNSLIAWNPSTLEKILYYLSCIDHGLEKTKQALENFSDYYVNNRFDKEIPSGLYLP